MNSLREEDGRLYPDKIVNHYPLVVDYSPYYYYPNLKNKMKESMSVNNCTIAGASLGIDYGQSADLSVRVISPPQYVVKKWTPDVEKLLKHRIFTQVSNNLCSSKVFQGVVRKGFFKRAKGCYKVYGETLIGRKYKRFNDYGATLHPEHVRCDNVKSASVCDGKVSGLTLVDKFLRELHAFPFVVTAQNVVVARSGMLALPCGPFGLLASCEAVNWGIYTANGYN